MTYDFMGCTSAPLQCFARLRFGGRVAACMNWPDADHGFGLGRFPDQVMEFGAPLMSQSCNGSLRMQR